jgi:hypothetical protein
VKEAGDVALASHKHGCGETDSGGGSAPPQCACVSVTGPILQYKAAGSAATEMRKLVGNCLNNSMVLLQYPPFLSSFFSDVPARNQRPEEKRQNQKKDD